MNGVAFPSPFPTQHMITERVSVAAHTLGPTTLESEVGESLRSGLAWFAKWVQGQWWVQTANLPKIKSEEARGEEATQSSRVQ